MPRTLIYIHRKVIEQGGAKPVIIRRNGEGQQFASSVTINGPSRVVHDPHAASGPKVWIETDAEVEFT